jgi:hypothetical protein
MSCANVICYAMQIAVQNKVKLRSVWEPKEQATTITREFITVQILELFATRIFVGYDRYKVLNYCRSCSFVGKSILLLTALPALDMSSRQESVWKLRTGLCKPAESEHALPLLFNFVALKGNLEQDLNICVMAHWRGWRKKLPNIFFRSCQID